jgi:hypothetical protein
VNKESLPTEAEQTLKPKPKEFENRWALPQKKVSHLPAAEKLEELVVPIVSVAKGNQPRLELAGPGEPSRSKVEPTPKLKGTPTLAISDQLRPGASDSAGVAAQWAQNWVESVTGAGRSVELREPVGDHDVNGPMYSKASVAVEPK